MSSHNFEIIFGAPIIHPPIVSPVGSNIIIIIV